MMSKVTHDNMPKINAVSLKLLLSQQQDGTEKWADHMVLEALELLEGKMVEGLPVVGGLSQPRVLLAEGNRPFW